MASEAERPPVVLSRDDAPALAIMVLAIVAQVRHFAFYVVPNSDFFAIAGTAGRVWSWNLPDRFTRPPLYAIVMGGVAKLIPGEDPLLVAGLLVNILLSAATMLALYLLAKRFVGRAAFFVILLFALDPNGIEVTLQPLAQTLAVSLVVWGCALAGTRPKTAWSFAALASIARYEGAALMPALFVRDLVARRPLGSTVVRAVCASVPLLLWITLNYMATGQINPYFGYFGDATDAAGWSFIPALVAVLQGIVAPPSTWVVPAALLIPAMLAVVSIGFVAMWRKSLMETVPILTYFAITLGINVVFFAIARQHVVMFSWAINLATVAGLAAVVHWARRWVKLSNVAAPGGRVAAAVVTTAVLSTIAWGGWSTRGEGAVSAITVVATTLTIAWFCIVHLPARLPKRVFALCLLVPAAGLFARENLYAIEGRLDEERYVKGALRAVGEWVRDNTSSGDLVVLAEPWVAAYYAGPDAAERFVRTEPFAASTPEEFVAEAHERGVDFVVWDSDYPAGPEDFYYWRYRIAMLEPLRHGRSTENFALVKTVHVGTRAAYIYRLLS